jgi:hypothetical protein
VSERQPAAAAQKNAFELIADLPRQTFQRRASFCQKFQNLPRHHSPFCRKTPKHYPQSLLQQKNQILLNHQKNLQKSPRQILLTTAVRRFPKQLALIPGNLEQKAGFRRDLSHHQAH